MVYTIWLLQCVTFVDLLAVGLIIPLLSGHVRTLGASHVYVGLLGSVYSGFQLTSGPLIGSLSDLKGRKPVLIVTLLISGAAYTLMGFTNSLTVIIIIRAVLGLSKQTQILTRALVPDYEANEEKHSEIYGKMAAISGIGITIGPVIGGHLVEDHPDTAFKMIAVLVGFCFLTNAGLVYLLPKTISQSRRRRKPVMKKYESKSIVQAIYDSCKESVIELYKIEWCEFGTIFLFKGLIGFALSMHYSNYTMYLQTMYSLSPKAVGYIISFQGIIGSICSYFMGYINTLYTNDKDYSVRNFHVFLILTFSLLGSAYSFNVYIYALCLIPLAIGNAVGRLVTLEMILKKGHGEHTATLIGASNSVRSLSGVIAPMVSGVVRQYYGVTHVVYTATIVSALGAVISFQHKNKIKQD